MAMACVRRSPGACVLFGLLLAGTLWAGGGPENVLLVVNGESWSSQSIANEYVAMRGIPPTNVVTLKGIGTSDTIDVDNFRKLILVPVLRHLEKTKLRTQIDYVIYSSDFPFRVDISGDLGKRKFPKTVGKMASLTGLTFLYQAVLTKRPDYVNLNANWYALQPFRPDRDPPWSQSDRELYGTVQRSFLEKHERQAKKKKAKEEWTEEDKAWERKQWEDNMKILRDLLTRQPYSLEVRYNLACGLSVTGKLDEAMRELTETIDGGWCDVAVAIAARNGWQVYTDFAKDEDFAPLRERADFKALLKKAKEHPIHMPPARAFSASAGWTSTGERCAPYRGSRYFLSTMLGYTSGRGNSYGEVISYLQRARRADEAEPDGTVYLMRNTNVRSTSREWAIPGVVKRLREDGRRVAVERGKLPQGKQDVAGVMTGTAAFDWAKSGSMMRPGAICEHLTSFGGVMSEGSSQTPLSAFLAAGAAGASGTVVEPYAIQSKFPNAFIQAYYAEGCSLAEAFYQSVTGPYQLLIVGDPLCQPHAKPPVVQVAGLTPDQVVKGKVKVKLSIVTPGPAAVMCHLYLDGRHFALVSPQGAFDLPTEKLADGYHEFGVVAVGTGPVQAQGRLVVPFLVGNRRTDFDLLKLPKQECLYGERIAIKADIAGVARLELFANGQPMGGLDSGQGSIQLDTGAIGMGPVAIRYGLLFEDGSKFTGRPSVLMVQPPAPLSLAAKDLPKKREKGIQLLSKREEKKQESTVGSLKGDWLAKGGAVAGATFAARGYFSVAKEGLHQFQFRGNVLGSCRLKVDGKLHSIPPGDGWRSLPVCLAPGMHRFTLSGRGMDKPRLDVRFGGPGCQTVSDKRFERGVAE
jgi:hypothetical protein